MTPSSVMSPPPLQIHGSRFQPDVPLSAKSEVSPLVNLAASAVMSSNVAGGASNPAAANVSALYIITRVFVSSGRP